MILREKISTARKRHRCEECCGSIESGEKYLNVAHVFEGDFCTYKAHLLCREAAIEANTVAESDMHDWFFIHDIPMDEMKYYPKAAAIFNKKTTQQPKDTE